MGMKPNQVQGRVEDDPDQVDEVPVVGGGFDAPVALGGVLAAHPVAQMMPRKITPVSTWKACMPVII
jgi:hypothetical protein